MYLSKTVIFLLLLNTLSFASNIDKFLDNLKVPPLKQALCRDKLHDYGEYMACLEDETKSDPSVENLNFLATQYAKALQYKKALKTYQESIKKGDTEAMYASAIIYNEFFDDTQKALSYLLQIKEYKDSTCQIGGIYLVADDKCYFSFINEYRAKSKTLDFYNAEIDQGNMKGYGCKALYYMYLEEYDNAKDAIEDGIEKDDLTSIFLMGQWYSKYGHKDRDKRYDYYEEALSKGSTLAAHNLGVIATQLKKWERAARYFRAEVMNGNEKALLDLGHVYAEKRAYKTAEKIYRKLVEYGNYESLHQAGIMYAERKNPEEYARAEPLFKECLSYGYSECTIGYGNSYLHEHQDFNKSIKIYKLGAKMGNSAATYSLGVIYHRRYLQEQDLAIKWYKKAVIMGESSAAFNLGHMYEDEIDGLLDYPEAIKWYQKAVDLGDDGSYGRIVWLRHLIKEKKEKEKKR